MSRREEYYDGYYYDTDDDWFTFYWQDTREGKAAAEQADTFENRKRVAYFDDKTQEENR